MLESLARQLQTMLQERLRKEPALNEELSWFFQEPGLLQFFDALRAISKRARGIETVHEFGRRAAKLTVPKVPNRPDLALEIAAKKLESAFKGFKVKVKKLSAGRAKVLTWFEKEDTVGGWAFCHFVAGWLVGAVEQAERERVAVSKHSCGFNRGNFIFPDGELKAGPGREVVFYPKENRPPKMVGKRSGAGKFKFRGVRFGEKYCQYNMEWKASLKDMSLRFGLKRREQMAREEFSAALNKLEEELERYRDMWDRASAFHSEFLEFLRSSNAITSKRGLWDGLAQCLHEGIGFDRVSVFEVTEGGLKQVYQWDSQGRMFGAEDLLELNPQSPEMKALRGGRAILVSQLEQTVGVPQIFSQKWFSAGYAVAPLGEPPNYSYIVWADTYRKKRPPTETETREMDLVACAASLALTKLETIEELEERVEERTRTMRELTTKLNRMYQEVRESEAIKSQFLSIVGHELKAPLNSILGLAQLLLKGMDGPLTEEQRQDVEAIYKSSEHLFRLISDILDLSRLESKRLKLSFHTTDLAEVTREVVRFIEPQAKHKGLQFETSSPRFLKAVVEPKRISQVITNLCTNAIKYTPEGKVRLALVEDGNEAIIIVEDSGPGIPVQHRDRIFEPFYQINQKRKSGLGLGLAITKRLVEMHGGIIQVGDSEALKGAKFVVRLPRWRHESA